jgi:hypothetical protein
MVSLLPHLHEVESPQPKACTSDSYYWVVTDGGAQRAVCGPHLHLMLGQFLIEHPHIAGEDPLPGTTCEYLEVSR